MVALLLGSDRDGAWAERMLAGQERVAPHLMPVEVGDVLRRRAVAGDATVSLAHTQLMVASVELFPYAPFARRVWELRNNVSAYDAWYVALAESLDAPLVTLDRRLMRATGPRCAFSVPPAWE
jgi:predicted nucleic acid-binding protein